MTAEVSFYMTVYRLCYVWEQMYESSWQAKGIR